MEPVAVDGGCQWISIRGRNRANPVLLFIHGGPGTPQMPLRWGYQNPWEDFFTVVNWDQRGVGKNADAGNRETLRSTMTLQQHLTDALAVVDHLRTTLQHPRVAVLGYSWGSLLGVLLAAAYPDRLSVCASVGQAVGMAGESIIQKECLQAARQAGDETAVRELEVIGRQLLDPSKTIGLESVQRLRLYARRYDGMWYGQPTLDLMHEVARLSPDYTDQEKLLFTEGSGWIGQTPLIADLMACDLRVVGRLEVPMVVLQGRYDLATPYAQAAAWLEALQAPAKTLVTFERSAHFVMFEEPGRFLLALLEHVLPVAGGAPPFNPRPRGADLLLEP